jgi:hypothetical protein
VVGTLSSIFVYCPFCGEKFEAVIDASFGDADYVEDCPVCCRPINMHLHTDENGEIDDFSADRDD